MTIRPFVVERGGVRLFVRVTPRAKRTEATGLVETAEGRTAVAVRLAAPPVEGAANRALADYVATALNVPRSAVSIASGGKSRLKQVAVAGLSVEVLAEWLDRLPRARTHDRRRS